MKTMDRERRDWRLLFYIVLLGILLMIIAGQIAIRVMPNWSVNAGMQSRLDPNSASSQPMSLFQPLLPQILTPMAWAESYLTPGQDVSFPPFFVFVPSATPSPTTVSPTPTEPSPTDTATVTVSPIPTTPYVPPPTSTTNPPDDDDDPDPVTVTVTATPTEQPPTGGYPSTPPDGYVQVPPPSEIEVGPPDGSVGSIPQGQFTIIDLGSTPIVVVGPTETNYDMVYYEAEYNNSGEIRLDSVIIGISIFPDGQIYYEVFNWGNGIADTNTNVASVTDEDNASISMNDLYSNPGTGILIDVDNAPSEPPPGGYQYVVIISPVKPPPPTDTIQVDSVEVIEVSP
jgi:hypothetical protein